MQWLLGDEKTAMTISPAMTINDVAVELKCSRTHVQNLIHGRVSNVPPLPAVKIGALYRIRRESFDRWIKKVEAPEAA